MSIAKDKLCGKTIVEHFKNYAVTDYVWQTDKTKKAKLKALVESKHTGQVQFIMPSSRSGALTEGEIRRSGKRFYDKDNNNAIGVCDDFAAGVCYGILMDNGAGQWTSSSAELIQGGGHSYVICNRNAVSADRPASEQVNKNTFILDAWAWCLNCCEGSSVISGKSNVTRHLAAFHPTKVPANGSARAGGITCTLTIDAGARVNKAPKKRRCFLTTAACDAMGLPDNCEELTLLRWYRDNQLLTTPDGQADVESYYQLAPKIIDAINARGNAESIYRHIFLQHIAPSAKLIKAGNYDQAYRAYRNMVEALELETGVS